MKLKCKCGKILTKDLRMKKKLSFEKGNIYPKGYFLEYGSFISLKKEKIYHNLKKTGYYDFYTFNGNETKTFHHYEKILVNKNDLIEDIIPEFKEGFGCCDWSMEDLYCSCGNFLGEMNFDCYLLGTMDFKQKNIIRLY